MRLYWSARIRSSLLVALVLGGAAVAKEPVKVAVGDPSVDGSVIRPYTNRWRLTVARPGGEPREVATVTDEVVSSDAGALKRTQVTRYDKGITTTDVNVFDAKTLAPVSMDFTRSDTGASHHREFRGALVRGRHVASPSAVAEEAEATFDAAVFDFYGGMYGLLIAAFPLGEGYAATIPAVDEDELRRESVTFRVVRRERVDAGPTAKVDAWVVDVDTKQGPMTFWLTKAPPYVIKLVWAAPNGLTWTYTQI